MLLKELNQVIDYIEAHLSEDLSLESISDYAGVSDYHFRTVFFHLSGMTLSEYVKNRKLSEANKDLLNGEKVTDVAFKYGYQSVDGFTRAFKNIEPYEIVNASYDADENFLKEEGYLTHLIGVLTTEENISDQLDKVRVEACTWAVFPNEGPFPYTLQETMAKTYSEWLPTSDYEIIPAPNFSFTKMDSNKKDYAYSEIWIPVRKKK